MSKYAPGYTNYSYELKKTHKNFYVKEIVNVSVTCSKPRSVCSDAGSTRYLLKEIVRQPCQVIRRAALLVQLINTCTR